MTSWGFSLQRSTVLADPRQRTTLALSPAPSFALPAPADVRVGATAAAPSALVRTGMSNGSIAMAVLAGAALGGMVFLVTTKPLYAGLAALGGLFIGSQLGSETGA